MEGKKKKKRTGNGNVCVIFLSPWLSNESNYFIGLNLFSVKCKIDVKIRFLKLFDLKWST